MESLANRINESVLDDTNADLIYEELLNESLLFDFKKLDILEIIGMLRNPKKYAKSYVIRWVTKKLADKNLMNKDVEKIINSILKYYPLVSGKDKKWFGIF